MPALTFDVLGNPAPQGSKRAIVNRYTGKAAMVEDSSRTKPWRADVREAALHAWDIGEPFAEAIRIDLTFRFLRPMGHYGARGLRGSAPAAKVTKPDVDKLARAVLDAIKGVVYRDDAQVVELHVRKRWVLGGEAPGCLVAVSPG
jgi:crossover junction endodeoxyribonuclease RusA